MAAIINALFGTYPDPDQQNTTNQTVVEGTTGNTTERLLTSAVADDVHVKSVISSETQANSTLNNKLNINNLLSQLSTTHSQVDQYSRARTSEINDQVQKSIADVLAKTQRQQEELLVDANRRHLTIDTEYQVQLQKAVEALDAVKAKTLADLERDLQAKQQAIMSEAKREIDLLNDRANAAKLDALVEAQEQAKHDISNLADQVGVLGQQETQHLLQSTTTTTITSHAHAAGHTETALTAVADNQMQVAVKSPSELVPAPTFPTATQETATAFGTATGASELTTTPATIVGTEIKATKDNTTF